MSCGSCAMPRRAHDRFTARASCTVSRSGRSCPGRGMPRNRQRRSSIIHHARARAAKATGVVSGAVAFPKAIRCNSRTCANAPRRPGLIRGSVAMPFGEAISGSVPPAIDTRNGAKRRGRLSRSSGNLSYFQNCAPALAGGHNRITTRAIWTINPSAERHSCEGADATEHGQLFTVSG